MRLNGNKNWTEILEVYFSCSWISYNFLLFLMSNPLGMESSPSTPMILHYYSIRGVAQPIRLLLNYLELEYTDNYLQKNEEN